VTLEFSRVTLPPLVTLDQAKDHLHETSTARDADIQAKLDEAQEVILSYVNIGADPTWTAATAPAAIRNSIKLLLGYYDAERGDGTTPDPWPALHQNLAAYRDPTVK
jgi:hypothetical protein